MKKRELLCNYSVTGES